MMDRIRLSSMVAACLLAAALIALPAPARCEQISLNIDTTVLSGAQKLACEAILCLSSGKRPPECDPALNHYFGIKKKKLKDTLKARKNFLNMCPVVDSPGMPDLVDAIVQGAEYCDAASLNKNKLWAYRSYDKATRTWSDWADGRAPEHPNCSAYDLGDNWSRRSRFDNENDYRICVERKMVVDNKMPGNCANYHGHEYTYFETLHYEGDKYNGGYWVD